MTIFVVAFLFPLFRSAEHEVDAALVVEIDVSGGVARLAAADAGVKVQPLPGVTSGNLEFDHEGKFTINVRVYLKGGFGLFLICSQTLNAEDAERNTALYSNLLSKRP